MKTKEELNILKESVETINKKLTELTEEELAQVSGGNAGIVLHNMPQKKDDEKYVLLTQANNDGRDDGKDHYENIILGG